MKTTIKIIIFLLATTVVAQENKHVQPLKRVIPANITTSEKSVATVYEKALPAVVTIFTSSTSPSERGLRQGGGLGSGVLVSHDCHILTAAHVVSGNSDIMVKTQDGKMRKATVLFSEANADIALLKLDIPDSTLVHATLGDSDKLVVGQNIYAIGSPYGMENSFSSGIISAFRGFNKIYDGTVKVEFIQTDAAINSGNSGGPLFNSNGEVIGIASSILTVSGGFQGIGMAVTINTAKDLLSFEDRPWIGVDGLLLVREELEHLFNQSLEGGVLIQSVAKGSPAYKAGLRAGDIKAVVNGRELFLGGDLIVSIENHNTCHVDCMEATRILLQDKNSLEIKYMRDGQLHTTTLDVSESRKNFLKKM